MKLYENGAYLVNGRDVVINSPEAASAVNAKTGKTVTPEDAKKQTIAYGILKNHNTSGNMEKLQIKFDKLTSHDITFVGIIQTARASGLEKFPIPYVLTNCHNSLCAVGGTINEDDHMFGLTCAKKYGGIYVPPHQAVIHQFAREMLAGGGKMILGSDSHTRYGALGTMAIGEGGPELVKQLLNKTYDIDMPGVVGKHPDVDAPLRRQQEGPLSGAVPGGGQRTGVAVGQNTVAVLQQAQAVFGDGGAFGDVVLMDGYCPLVQSVQHLAPGIVDMLQGGAHHLPDGPAQIHRRGTGRVQLLAIVAEALQKRGTVLGPDGLGQHIHAVGGADADGRGPPHPQGPDGLHHLVNGLEADLLLLPRQQGLVDDVKGLRLPVVADVLGMGYRGDIWHGGSSFPNGGPPSGLPGQRLRVLPSSVSQFPRRRKGGRSAAPFSSSVVMA